MDYISMGKRIKLERVKRGMTQTELAGMINVSINFISQIERAKSKFSVGTLYAIAQALDVSVDVLMGHIPSSEQASYTGVEGEMFEILKQMNSEQRMFVIEHARKILELGSGGD